MRYHAGMRPAARRHHASRPTIWEVHSCGRLEGRFESKDEAQEYVKSRGKPGVKLTLRQIEIEEPVMQHATKKKSPAQLQREIDEVLASSPAKPAVKCPSPEHPLYPELRHIRQVAHDTSWTASQLAKDAEDAFRHGDCAKAATILEASKRVIAKERRKRPRPTGRAFATMKASSATGEPSAATKKKLVAEIRKQIAAGYGPCRAANRAIHTLGLDGVIGVQGDDAEIASGEDHFELWLVHGDPASPYISLNLEGKKWRVNPGGGPSKTAGFYA